MKFLLEIITPERKAFSEEVDYLSVPSSDGVLGILARHAPLFASLVEGELKIVSGGKDYYLAIGGGFIQVTKEKVIVLVSRAVHSTELNEEEIKRAEQEAKDIIAKTSKDTERLTAQSTLRRSLLEMKVLRHRKHNPQIN